MAKATRSQTELYLLGEFVTELTGSKLPSMRLALGFFLHRHLKLMETINEAKIETIEEIAKFRQKARIPTQEPKHCRTKLHKLFEGWRLLKKNKSRTAPTQRAKELAFVSQLEDLFDIAHFKALTVK